MRARAHAHAEPRDSILVVSTPNPDNGRNLSCSFPTSDGMGNVIVFFFLEKGEKGKEFVIELLAGD